MDLKLYKNFPINNYTHQIYYGSQKARDTAFDKYADKDFKNLASCDKSKQIIRLNTSYYVGNQYNYGVIIESNKRYYIFITKIEWLSNLSCCIMHYTYDYWQTYCYDLNFKMSYIERMHVNDDNFGNYLIDEGLPIITYNTRLSQSVNGSGVWFGVAVSDTTHLYRDVTMSVNYPTIVRLNNKEFSSCVMVSQNPNDLTNIINDYHSIGKGDSIIGMYMFYDLTQGSTTQAFFTKETKPQEGIFDYTVSVLLESVNSEPQFKSGTVNLPSTISGYSPKNKKCFMYPYNYVEFNNNQGQSFDARFELSNSVINYRYFFPKTLGGSGILFLKNYDGVNLNFNYSLNSQVNPNIPYASNTYANYLGANINALKNNVNAMSDNYNYQSFKNSVGFASNVANNLYNPLGIVNNTTNYLISQMDNAQNATQSLNAFNASLADNANKPNVVKGSFNGYSPSLTGENGFKINLRQVNYKNIKMIDNYFEMFGYKVNELHTPNLNSRPYWNYIKTVDVNIVGNVPANALNVVKSMFNSGVTLWHDITAMYDYSLNNH